MSALNANVVEFKLPKKPKVREKESLPDQRKFAVLPLRALKDKNLTDIQVRVLGLICSYTNRAGITFVGTQQLATDLQVSKQAISKQLVKLKAAGYVEVIRKGFKGFANDTIRVIFDPSIDTETAIAVTSRIEDTRTPAMKKEQQKEVDNTIDPEGLKRIQDMIKGAYKPVQPPAKEYEMPKGDTITVAKMKAEIAAKKARREKHTVNQEVVNVEPHIVNHTVNHMDNQKVDIDIEERNVNDMYKVIVNKELKVNLKELEVLKMLVGTIEVDELETVCRQLADRYRSEGIDVPTSEMQLANDLMYMSAENLLRAHGV